MRPVNLRAARRIQRHRSLEQSPVRIWPALAGCAIVLAAASPWLVTAGERVARSLQTGLGLIVAELQIDGARRVDDATILETLGIEAGMPIFAADVHAARERLEGLAWVETASVRRDLPHRLTVKVVEHRPLALWLGPDGTALLAASGAAVHVDRRETPSGLPLVVGAGAPARAGEIGALLDAARTMGSPVERLELAGGQRWRLHLARGIRVELPAEEPLAALDRLGRLQAESQLLDRALAAIDLRLPDRLVVTPLPIVRQAEAGR